MDPQSAYQDTTLPIEERVDDLVSRMTLEEKISQIVYDAPVIERLDVPQYNWWNECLHGVGRAGIATIFPQAIGLAATWNTDLMHQIATAISDEARAKHHEAVRQGIREIYIGLTFWSPNINIFRDPRWGRRQETYGECPYLTGLIAAYCDNTPRQLSLIDDEEGLLTGKYNDGIPEDSRAARSDWLQGDLTEGNVAKVRRLAPLAQGLELEVSQLALAWILRRPEISTVITGATRPEHVLSNVKASGVRLTPDILEEIEGILENAPADE